jgi:hypothetical protein
MSLRDSVSHIENLLSFQSKKEPFTIGLSGSHRYFNTFIQLFLKHHDYDVLYMDCGEYSYCVHQDCEQFVAQRIADAVEQAKKLNNPLLLIENHGVLHPQAQQSLTTLLKEGLILKDQFFENSYENSIIAKKEFLPVMVTTQHSFSGSMAHIFFDESQHYIESSSLRYNTVLEEQYSIYDQQRRDRYIQVEKDSIKILTEENSHSNKPGI